MKLEFRSRPCIAAALLSLGCVTVQAQSDPRNPTNQAELFAPYIERDLGLNLEQYRAYLEKEAVAMGAAGAIEQAVGTRAFGGFYMHRLPDKSYENRALLTDMQLADGVRKLGADTVLPVKYSLAYLHDAQRTVERASDNLQLTRFVSGVLVIVQSNKVRLEVSDEKAGRAIAAATALPTRAASAATRAARTSRPQAKRRA